MKPVILIAALLSLLSRPQSSALQRPVPTPRERVIAEARKHIGLREATGRNDGPQIEAWLKSVGASKGDPYCAAFVYGVSLTALGSSTPYPKTAWSPTMVADGTRNIATARPADTFGIYFRNRGRIAHTGLVERLDGSWLYTIEANTAPDSTSGERDRNGNWTGRKRRHIRTIHSVKSWL